MKKMHVFLMLAFFLSLSADVWAEGRITITSAIPGDVYLDGVKKASVNPGDSYDLYFKNPGNYVVEVRGANSKLVHREEFSLDPVTNEHRTIQAFSEALPANSKTAGVSAGPSDPKAPVTREELHAAVDQAAKRAKSEALAEEAARRKRAQKREATNHVITHVIAVEGRHLPSGVKGMERIKLLGDLIPVFGSRK